MTLREYLDRRTLKIAVPSAVVVLTVWVIAAYTPRHSTFRSLAFCVGILFIFTLGILSRRARCLRCHARLETINTGSWGIPQRSPYRGLDHCANCGLHLDQEIPASADSARGG
jgi:hypothetical protein